jgi:hypothetical protein
VFLRCTEGYSQNRITLNALQTTVPFLTLVTNARIGGYGEIGVVSSSFYKDAGLIQNPALLSDTSKHVGGSSSYMPWLRNLTTGIYMFENNKFFAFNDKNAIGSKFSYFNPGQEVIRDSNGYYFKTRTNLEYLIQLSYSHTFNEHFSAGAGLKYIKSDIRQGILQNGYSFHAAHAYAADLGVYYKTGFTISEKLMLHLNAGSSVNNLGTKIKYTADPDNQEGFIPACLSMGVLINPEWIVSENITLNFDIAYQAEKFLVPTPPVYYSDSAGNPVV